MPVTAIESLIPHYPCTDTRLTNLTYINTAYAGPAATTLNECRERAAALRKRVLIGAGLSPEPERTPLNVRIFDRAMHDGYSVEKVHFESRPGFLVTGNLFRPLKWHGKRPAILCPHGHWNNGRLEHSDQASVVGRSLELARLGFVVFSYDMIGYNDSCQIEHRADAATSMRMLYNGVTSFGLQLWNSIRAVDFVTTLNDVDPLRIGCTGASGGGTQTYFLALVDDRIRVAVPVCMMSSNMQGGCTCEEPPFLHLDNISTLDVVAALAPRPVLLPSVTGDWTNQNPGYDVPVVRQIYAVFGAADRIENIHFTAQHNYNKDIREHVYAWFLRWLDNDRKVGKRVKEGALNPPPPESLRLFPDKKLPKQYKTGEAALQQLMDQHEAVPPTPPREPARVRALRTGLNNSYAEILGAYEPEEMICVSCPLDSGDTDTFTLYGHTLGRRGRGEQIPALWAVPKKTAKNAPAALVICGNGKAELFQDENKPSPLLNALINAGVRVLAIDLLGKGEMAGVMEKMPMKMDSPLYYAFNRSLLAHRVQETLTAIAALRWHFGANRPALVGTGIGAIVALLARPLAKPLGATALDMRGEKTGQESYWLGENFHPHLGRFNGLCGAAAFSPATPLLVAGADASVAKWLKAAYQTQKKPSALKTTGAFSPKDVAKFVS